MVLTLQRVDKRYGSVSQYVRDHCGFSAEDTHRIRKNMLFQVCSYAASTDGSSDVETI